MKPLRRFVNLLKNNRKQLFLLIVVSAVTGISVYLLKPTKIQLSFPYILDLPPRDSYSCESLASSFIYGGNNALTEGITAEVSKGTDKIAIEIEDDKLHFLTRASVEVGIAKGEPWPVVKDSNDRLVAVYNGLDEISTDFNIFILNKKNGIAVWSKTNADLFGTENPSAQSFYLICR